jgi:predicted Mrr-cat superfamily restriction endonuclease
MPPPSFEDCQMYSVTIVKSLVHNMPANYPTSDVSTLDIENLDIAMLSETQIVEFISRNKLDLSRLVNETLIANGYKTRVSQFGNDGSVDILAEGKIGPFGFTLPRIAVLVKPDIDLADPDLAELEAFMTLSSAANAMFVSWTGFTDASKAEAGRLFHQAKFWDVSQLVNVLKANFEKVSNSLSLAQNAILYQ